ncbi:MAG: hypothetical protein JWO50_472 [Candidatus Kaiserbacteria bacterium]|nr:hypothetical protein [Candidatus Kaiserbacteria bacterium]
MVGGNTLIPYYDHLLTDADVPDLTLKVKNQLISLRVSEIDFYIEDKPSWSLYRQVLRTAATSLHIRFQEHTLPKPP